VIGLALPALGLALLDERVDAGDLDVEQRFDSGLDLRLGGVVATLKTTCVVLGSSVDFSVMCGATITS
jgi:hypothetical protein